MTRTDYVAVVFSYDHRNLIAREWNVESGKKNA